MEREKTNPIITPEQFPFAWTGFEVFGTFNAAATTYNDETILLVRVAQRPVQNNPQEVVVPFVDLNKKEIAVKNLQKNNPELNFSDSRVIWDSKQKYIKYLTSISSLWIARSKDGVNFTFDSKPFISPETEWETWGCEDARITKIDDTYWINYTAVSERGIATALASTKDFVTIERHGIIFAAPNRDVVIFPEKLDGKFIALHRPMPSYIGAESIWFADSSGMTHWGNHKLVAEPRPGSWDSQRIGAGSPPIKTDQGWLDIYHGADNSNKYNLGAILLDFSEPWKVLARSSRPLIEPTEKYEKEGVYPNVCFTCGHTQVGDEIRIYYGVADRSIALARVSVGEILESLK